MTHASSWLKSMWSKIGSDEPDLQMMVGELPVQTECCVGIWRLIAFL
jgi:hypothetical protein